MVGIINHTLESIKEKIIQNPFPYVIVENFFTLSIYNSLCNTFNEELKNNNFKQLGKYDAFGNIIAPDIFLAKIFYSKPWIDFVTNLFDVPTNYKTDASFHHHKINSKSGWIHNDYNLVYVRDNPNHQGVSAWDNDTTYWQPQEGVPASKRAATMICFLNNGSWNEGDNGEIGLFNNYTSFDSVFKKVAPINNTALFFKCAENSWHAYCGENKNERNSLIQFFLKNPD